MAKFTDKLLNMMKLNDDYDEYDDYDDYNDYEEEPKSRREASRKEEAEEIPSRKRGSKKELVDDYDEEEAPAPKKPKTRSSSSKVVPMRSHRSSGLEVCVFKPKVYEEATDIIDVLLQGKAVVLNLEGLHIDIAQKITDFSSGATYAIGGSIQKISQSIFILAPDNVDVSGDFSEVLSTEFDLNSLE